MCSLVPKLLRVVSNKNSLVKEWCASMESSVLGGNFYKSPLAVMWSMDPCFLSFINGENKDVHIWKCSTS